MNYKNDNTEMLSVVIPIYNVEKYLKRCIDSVISQTYKNIEIILVDDGSPDKCGEICDLYALKDKRIKVIHKENGGLSDARNIGTKAANGKYIAFIDSDDYISSDYFEYLYSLLIKTGADISVCRMIKTEEDVANFGVDNSKLQEQVLSGIEACRRLFFDDLYITLVTACGKLYNSEIVKKYPFPKGRKHEDEATTCKFYYESQKVVIGNKRLYAYYQNPTSITHSQGDKLNEDIIWALEHRAMFFEECKEPILAKYSWNIYFHYCIKDSLENNGRCDKYLENFDNGKTLSKRVLFEYKLYSTSKVLYKIYSVFKRIMRIVIKQILLKQK